MRISKEALKEYKAIYKKEFGKDISDDKALEQATNLLNLVKAVSKPIKSTEKNKDEKTRGQI